MAKQSHKHTHKHEFVVSLQMFMCCIAFLLCAVVYFLISQTIGHQ